MNKQDKIEELTTILGRLSIKEIKLHKQMWAIFEEIQKLKK